MAYVSLYRKYRPQIFEDVVGQDHVTRTLKNAVQGGRIASGYLFCGTRGTAKTTCARILAKALNCIGPNGDLTAPTPEPCGVCGPCKAIANSSFVDVIEMDAASHGKVDDVRDIVAAVKFQPMEGRYKVYIVDEAHQLSRDAMDAFLKTLEEPPDRVLFILATTDADKLPVTIASRCQVFEFKRGSVAQIASRLKEVLQTEGVTAEEGAINLVARAADGSYRDSLSLLEQVLAYQRGNITAADVAMALGAVDEDLLNRIVGLLADFDAAGVFTVVAQIMESGKDIRQFLKSLSERFRDMLFLRVGASEPSDVSQSTNNAVLKEQAQRYAPASLLQALETLAEAEKDIRTFSQHRLLLEMTLLRLIKLPAEPAISAPAPLMSAQPVLTKPIAPHISMPVVIAEIEEEELEESIILFAPEDSEEATEITPIAEEISLFMAAAPTAPIPEPSSTENAEILQRLQRAWQEVINRVSSARPAAITLITDAKPISLLGKTFTLALSNRFYVDRVKSNEAGRKMIEDQINRVLGAPEDTYHVRGILREDNSAKLGQSVAPAPGAGDSRLREAPPEPPAFNPLLDEVIALFGGRVEDDDTKG